MSTITKDIRDRLSKNVKVAVLGNSNRTSKDLAIDLIHASGQSYDEIAKGTFLHRTTVKKLAREKTKNPQSQTVDRVLKHFDVRLQGDFVATKSKFENQPKQK